MGCSDLSRIGRNPARSEHKRTDNLFQSETRCSKPGTLERIWRILKAQRSLRRSSQRFPDRVPSMRSINFQSILGTIGTAATLMAASTPVLAQTQNESLRTRL